MRTKYLGVGAIYPIKSLFLCIQCGEPRDRGRGSVLCDGCRPKPIQRNQEAILQRMERRKEVGLQRQRWVQKHLSILTVQPRSSEGRARKRRYQREMALLNDLTVEQWGAILRLYDYRCAYCGGKAGVLAKEHVTPVIKAGGTTAPNIVPACSVCNGRKGRLTAEEFGIVPAKRLMF